MENDGCKEYTNYLFQFLCCNCAFNDHYTSSNRNTSLSCNYMVSKIRPPKYLFQLNILVSASFEIIYTKIFSDFLKSNICIIGPCKPLYFVHRFLFCSANHSTCYIRFVKNPHFLLCMQYLHTSRIQNFSSTSFQVTSVIPYLYSLY